MLFSVILCLIVPAVAGNGIDLPDLLPFGPQAGDESLPPSNDAFAVVNLQQPIPFYGENRNYITVSSYLIMGVCHCKQLYNVTV